MDKVIYTVGYGILRGTHVDRELSFKKRLRYIRRGIGKPVTLVDIRKAASGSRNGVAFAMRSDGMAGMVRELGFVYTAETYLANRHGGTKRGLIKYRNELWFHLGPGRYEQEVFEASSRVKQVAEDGVRAVLLMCGCKKAFKQNGTTWNCHRVPLADVLVSELGDGWEVVHL